MTTGKKNGHTGQSCLEDVSSVTKLTSLLTDKMLKLFHEFKNSNASIYVHYFNHGFK